MGRCLLFLLLLLGCRDFLLTFLASAALSTSADDGILTSFLLSGKRSTNDKKENRNQIQCRLRMNMFQERNQKRKNGSDIRFSTVLVSQLEPVILACLHMQMPRYWVPRKKPNKENWIRL